MMSTKLVRCFRTQNIDGTGSDKGGPVAAKHQLVACIGPRECVAGQSNSNQPRRSRRRVLTLPGRLAACGSSIRMDGGLLGFALILAGPLREMPPKQRRKLLWRAVRRFSRVAILAVVVVISTGAYAILLHVPSVEGLLSTAYGGVLMIKLELAVFLFIGGGISLVLEGSSPFSRVLGAELILAIAILAVTGFLTSFSFSRC